ncbi:Chromogranin-A [Dissostichus eleginoides]|uniref:Chromogranin-A n=1 Tax=Dissostichus eleginoides TaxID=100907 RepID=A0AAD9F1K6_DISEL|nr:Chromogranin-A [Dissostichus eleginoides]
MIGRGLFVLTLLSSCVLSLPVTPSQLENEDVKVMKCIVEALADVLSRPRPEPVSQECLTTLKTDDRLVSILRHHNFLKELQEIAVRGGQERALLQRDATAEPTTQSPQTADDFADRSMLEALGGPGERSILSQKKRDGNGDRDEEKEDSRGDGESQEDNHVAGEVKEKREKNESPGSHASESEDESTEGAGSGEKGDAPRFKSKEKTFVEEEWDDVKRFAPEKKQEEDEREMKKEGSLKRWAKRGKALALRKSSRKGAQHRTGGATSLARAHGGRGAEEEKHP